MYLKITISASIFKVLYSGYDILHQSCGQILILSHGDIVDSGIGLSYRPARLQRLAGRYINPMPEATIYPSEGIRIWLMIPHPLPKGGIESKAKACRLRKISKLSVFGFVCVFADRSWKGWGNGV